MTTISNLGTISYPSLSTATTSPSTATDTAGTGTNTGVDSGLVQDAVTLSSEADVLSTLGTGSLYNPLGLLQQFTNAGSLQGATLSATSGDSAAGTSQAYQDSNIVAQLPQNSSASGIYDASGLLSALPSSPSTSWDQLVQQQPDLAGTAVADATTLGVVSQLA
ncbi:MAG: hypothetical protein KGN39_02170 [Betaproteobacteria bacterium]|nr:hypothetical protein [Betaproteobacteria bacterium]